jgi:2-oxoglutarate dehydrogenase E1 component
MSGSGSTTGYFEALYARYLAAPDSVSEAWREFFADYKPQAATATAERPATEAPAPRLLAGAKARIASNMEASLLLPTATSARTIAVKFLEENRRIINQHQVARHGSKVSFTHLVAFAVVRAIESQPEMNAAYAEIDDKPHVLLHAGVNLGVAVDTEKQGERLLVVPNVKHAERLDFPGFLAAYDGLVARARSGTLSLEDFADTTITLTNPGTIGTTLSVPRLMAGQGVIVGTGAIGYPPEYAGLSAEAISNLGLSKVMTLTSTYDHRVIQGAESGAFLATIEKLLQGESGFYTRIFAELTIPQEPVKEGETRRATAGGAETVAKQAGVIKLVRPFRVPGHLSAHLDPLGSPPLHQEELDLSFYGLSAWDLDRRFAAGMLAGSRDARSLRETLDILRDTYCRYVGVEFMHIQELPIRRWLEQRMETTRNAAALSPDEQARILAKLNAAEAFEKFLHATYVGQKRFSLEGAETLVPMIDALLNDAAAAGTEEAVIGMSHRGRLNLLCNVVGKSYNAIFREFEGELDPDTAHGSGDVKYHVGAAGTHTTPTGATVALTLASNPSHLEAVDPVVEGMVRARQDRLGDSEHERVLPILLHGDAAFAGQGVVAETLNLSLLRGNRTGGTVHVVVNNQIGFTTGPQDARSSPYATDVARTVQAPIFHVNGDQPEIAVRVIRLALEFRNTWKRDVVVDLVCYRRWGHNEGDDPSYTNPLLYAKIESHRSVRKLYTEELLRRGDLTLEAAEQALADYRARLTAAFDEVKRMRAGDAGVPVATDRETVEGVARPSSKQRFRRRSTVQGSWRRSTVCRRIRDPSQARQQAAAPARAVRPGTVDGPWPAASLRLFPHAVGTPVRVSGEDSGRGTFSQRHAILYDHRSGARHIPLAHVAPGQARFQIFDSHLSEFAVLGFEYGYSVDYPETLVVWEAQFGDFANGGQVVTDQFIASAEGGGQRSGLTLLLPHGYEGQGPEHSSARIERFLQLAARGNLRIAQPTTPAQYFHLLRRQAKAEERKPLVVFTPKSLLRHKDAVSAPEAFTEGAFEPVLDDADRPRPDEVRRVVLCSGKLFYELHAARNEAGLKDVAIVRVEQYYPYPSQAIERILARYPAAADVCFTQEEPRNMGAFASIAERISPALRARSLRYAGRPRNPSPATGSHKRHVAEQSALVREALAGTDVNFATQRT